MRTTQTGQVTRSAADVYETFFVPALFEQWVDIVADAAHVLPGHRVLDVACGTGILTRTLAARIGPDGAAVGLDLNEGMLAVARRAAPDITWTHARAEAIPFEANGFDVVVCQFGLMFFEDQKTALREMMRVLRPGGRICVAVWDSLEHAPGYAAMTKLLRRLFGESVASALRAPFTLGDPGALRRLFADAGIPNVDLETRGGLVRFSSMQDWIHTEIKGWTLADVLDDAQVQLLLDEASDDLRQFVRADGSVAFDAPAHVVTATKLTPRTRN